MNSTLTRSQELHAVLQAMQNATLLVVGDLMLDRYHWGNVDRVSDEAPVPIVDVRKTEDRLGGVGNLLRNLRNLETKVEICGVLGDDQEGTLVRSLLTEESVPRDGLVIDRERVTSLKTRVMGRTQQMLRVDREDRSLLSPHVLQAITEETAKRIPSVSAVVISDYGKGVLDASLMEVVSETCKKYKKPLILDPNPRNYGLYKGITIAKPNRAEAERAWGKPIRSLEDGVAAAEAIQAQWGAESMLVSLGADGMVVTARGQEPIILEAVRVEVADVSGAGDTVVAVISAALAIGATLRDAAELAVLASGSVVTEVGTVPVSKQRLVRAIERRGIVG